MSDDVQQPSPTVEEPTASLETLPPPSSSYLAQAEARSLNFANPKLWRAMEVMSGVFIRSGALPQTIKNVPQLMMVFQAGYEMGMQPLESINAFYFVNGRLAIFGEAAIAQVQKHGHKVEFLDCDATKATCRITRKDDERSLSSTFTVEMAKQRGINNPVLTKYPENFLKFKAFHMTAKFIVPEVNHGLPIQGEPEEWKTEAREGVIATAAKSELEASLDEISEENEEAKTPTPVKVKGKRRSAREATVDQEPTHPTEQEAEETQGEAEVESDSARASRLIDEELSGKKLTPSERKFLDEYQKSGYMKEGLSSVATVRSPRREW